MRWTTLATALCMAAAGFAAPAMAERSTPRYTSLTVFGDSLVDAGNIFDLTGGATPSPLAGYANGRFTNGYDYTDLLNLALFGTPTTASRLGGTNFAYGGARATDTSPYPDLNAQLGAYQSSSQVVDPNGLYVLNFGGNDIFAIQNGTVPSTYASNAAFLADAVSQYAQGVQTLNDLGVRNILVTGFPVASAFSVQGDALLTSSIAGLSLNTNTTIFQFNALDFLTRVSTNPGAFGIAPFTQAGSCQSGGAAAIIGGCVGYFSFDGIHPVAAVQQALFQDVDRQFGLTAAVPEPASWIMMIGGLGLAGGMLRRRKAGLTVRFA